MLKKSTNEGLEKKMRNYYSYSKQNVVKFKNFHSNGSPTVDAISLFRLIPYLEAEHFSECPLGGAGVGFHRFFSGSIR